MRPYDGTEKYIFISYAHKDSKRVLPLIEGLAQAGLRVWFDEGIEVGSEWPMLIEERLRSCHRVIFFMTEASANSRNCFREINLALESGKEVLVVDLDRAEMKCGMQLLLSSSQSFSRDKFADDAALLQTISKAKLLEGCRGATSAASSAVTVTPKPTPTPTPMATTQAWNTEGSRLYDQKKYDEAAQYCRRADEQEMAGQQRPSIDRRHILKSPLGLLRRQRKMAAAHKEAPPPPPIDSVRFSAVAPQCAVPGKYLPVNIVMYEDAFREAVDNIIRSHGKKAKESQSGYRDVARNAVINVVLTSPDVTVEDSTLEQIWNGKYLNFEFAAKIPHNFAEEQILFSAAVSINGIIATKLKLILDCAQKSGQNIRMTREDYVSAFVSYASQDRNRVAAIVQGMKKARPDMDIFFDIESLRSGQKWEEVLKSEISNRDILFLCWSRFAKESKWVDMEWRYALENKGEDGIEPIPIESPDICPPPVELQQKHFNDRMLYIIRATASHENGRPCLIRLKTNECVTIDKPLFRIGKERSCVDMFIGDNVLISRCHATIIQREGKYYLIDDNSTNHTYINGEFLPSNVEKVISFGTKIKLADEEFEFTCK